MKYFATFGSNQLEEFDVNPMKPMVYIPGASENELRQRLREEPFNNHYCTSYPINEYKNMKKNGEYIYIQCKNY